MYILLFKFNIMNFKLAIFDLDETLWDGSSLYPDTKSILTTLKLQGMHLYIASFNPDAPKTCDNLGIHQYFNNIEYGSGKSKYQMIKEILKKHPTIPERDIVFYDNDADNVADVKKRLNINVVHINSTGIKWYDIIPVKNDTLAYNVEFPDFFNENVHLSDYARVIKYNYKC